MNRNEIKTAFDSLFEGLAQTSLELSKAQLVDELQDEGITTADVVTRMDLLFAKADKSVRKQSLLSASEKHKNKVASFNKRVMELPSSVSEKRALLESILIGNPVIRERLTVHFRDFKNIPEDELDSYIQQLYQLGAVTKPDDDDSSGK